MLIPAGSAIGFTTTTTVSGLALARLTGTMWIYCAVASTGVLSDPEEASKVVIDADINGARVNNIFQTPLDAMITTLLGQAAMIPVNALVPSDSLVTFKATVVNGAISAGVNANLTFRLYSGSREQWSHFLKGRDNA